MRKITTVLLFLFTLSSLFALSPERTIFNEAETRYKNGDLDFALSRYEELIQEYPLSEYVSDAFFRIAVITLRSGKIEEADILFERVEKRYRNTRFIDYLPFWKGLIRFKQERWKESSILFSSFLDNNPSSLIQEAYLYRAKAEFSLGKLQSAISILDNWFEISDDVYDNPYLLTFYLTLMEKNGEYSNVIDYLKNSNLESFEKPWMNRLYSIYAESLYKSGYIKESEVYYRKILEADPEISSIGFIRMFSIYKNNTDVQREIFDNAQMQLSGYPLMLNKFLLRVGIDSYNNGQFELAASYLWRIWRTGNTEDINSLVPVYLAKILVKEGNKDGAVDILSTYNSRGSSVDELVLYTLSNVLVKSENWQDAELNLKSFIFSFPESEYYSSAVWMYAYSLYKSGQFKASRSVIDSALAEGRGGAYTTDFILLSARVYIKLDNLQYALAMFKEYLPFDNNNLEIWFDIIKLQFNLGHYNSVADSFRDIEKILIINKENPYFSLIHYVAGLGDVAQGRYEEGLEKLAKVEDEKLITNNLKSIASYLNYYRAWALYKLSDYKESFELFKKVSLDYPESSIYIDSLYFAGWSAYLTENYALASKYFADYSKIALDEDKPKGLFFYSKSMYSDANLTEAELVFQNIYTKFPHSEYADDAMFEHGQILEESENFSLAISTYLELYNRYKTSPLAEESLFRIGEIYFSTGNYEKAQEAFYSQRLKYPSGKLGDVSLYWGAESAEKMGRSYGSILLLEKLLLEYPESSFIPNALQKIAFLYAEEGEYGKAINYYSNFLTSYSESESADVVRTQIKKLNLLQSGSDKAEAELLVIIEEKGIQTSESREAHIKLAKMYLYKFSGKEEQAFDLLTRVSLLRDQFPLVSAKALYYLGDYYSIKKDYTKAAKSFVNAATLYPEDSDLTGISLLRASEMAVAAGDIQTAEKMINLLEINFPYSGWLEEGKKNLEKNR